MQIETVEQSNFLNYHFAETSIFKKIDLVHFAFNQLNTKKELGTNKNSKIS
jgi:hypothetical protein